MPGNFERKACRKKQSRLDFGPTSSPRQNSSPPARSAHKAPSTRKKGSAAIEDREAEEAVANHVNFKMVLPISQEPSLSNGTDAPPSDMEQADTGDAESEVDVTSSRRIQSKTATNVGSTFKRSMRNSRRGLGLNRAVVDSSASSSSEDENEASRRPKRTPPQKSLPSMTDEVDDASATEDHESGYSDRPYQPGVKSKRTAKVATSRSFLAGGSSYNAPISSGGGRNSSKKPTSRKSTRVSITPSNRSKISEPAVVASGEEEDGDEHDTIGILTPQQTQTSSQRPIKEALNSSRSRRFVIDEDSEDDDLPTMSQLMKRTPSKDTSNLRANSESEEEDVVLSTVRRRRLARKVVIDEDDEDDNGRDADDDVFVTSSPLKRKRPALEVDSGDESDDLEVLPPPTLRKGRQKALLDDTGDDSDSNTLRSSAEHLQARRRRSSSPEKPRGRLTRRQRQKENKKPPKRTPQQKALELLKRRHAGEKITELTDSGSDEEEQGPGCYDSECSALTSFEDESESEAAQRKKEKPRNGKTDEEEGEIGDDDFIVDDDEEAVGVPGLGLNDIPIQFTNAAHKRKIEHFKDAIDWMVQRKINPAFNRKDVVYITAFQKLDDELRGYAVSKFASSAWRPGFRRALFARPGFFEEYVGVDPYGHPKCEACGRRKHLPSFKVSFRGRPYHKDSLEDVDDDTDSDDDEAEPVDYDEEGAPIPPQNTEYWLGSTCKANAVTAHRLIHWKHSLNEWVVEQLKSEGHLSLARLADREELSARKRGRIATDIVDEWEARGFIQELYNLLKNQLELARQDQQQRGRGGG